MLANIVSSDAVDSGDDNQWSVEVRACKPFQTLSLITEAKQLTKYEWDSLSNKQQLAFVPGHVWPEERQRRRIILRDGVLEVGPYGMERSFTPTNDPYRGYAFGGFLQWPSKRESPVSENRQCSVELLSPELSQQWVYENDYLKCGREHIAQMAIQSVKGVRPSDHKAVLRQEMQKQSVVVVADVGKPKSRAKPAISGLTTVAPELRYQGLGFNGGD